MTDTKWCPRHGERKQDGYSTGLSGKANPLCNQIVSYRGRIPLLCGERCTDAPLMEVPREGKEEKPLATPEQCVQEALGGYIDDNEIIVNWCVSMEIATPNGSWVAHRYGGGADGGNPPTIWAVVGLLTAALEDAKKQLFSNDVEDGGPG